MIVDDVEYPDSCPICSKQSEKDMTNLQLYSGIFCDECGFGMWKIFNRKVATNGFWIHNLQTGILGETTLDEFERRLRLESFE